MLVCLLFVYDIVYCLYLTLYVFKVVFFNWDNYVELVNKMQLTTIFHVLDWCESIHERVMINLILKMAYFKTLSKQAGEVSFVVKQSPSCLFPSIHFKFICSVPSICLIDAILTQGRQTEFERGIRDFV